MRWEQRRRSTNVEDRRGRAGRPGRAGLRVGGAGGLAVLAVAVVVMLAGGDPSTILGLLSDAGPPASSGPTAADPQEDRLAEFVSVVLADTEDTWTGLFRQRGDRYAPPRLVLFRDVVASACGSATSAVGPFYCPGDRQVYLDLSFFEELDRRFGAPGDFAQAYVVAHEVGHHIQTVLGVSEAVRREKRGRSEAEANALSVRQELQADCLAGVWAHHAHVHRQLLEEGDVAEGLRAAAAIGDDTLQRRAGGRVRPESFTHGSAEERVRWFRTGFDRGAVEACNTLPI